MLLTLLLTVLTVTSGEDTHYSEGEGNLLREGVALFPSGLAGNDSQEDGASLTWTGGNTTGKGERERHYKKGPITLTQTQQQRERVRHQRRQNC